MSHKGKESRKKEVETEVKFPDVCVLLPLKHTSKEGTGIRAFVFLLDFCVSVDFPNTKYPNFRDGGKVAGIGIPLQKTKSIVYLRKMEMCIVQVIDRIASTQLEPSPEEAIEFVGACSHHNRS